MKKLTSSSINETYEIAGKLALVHPTGVIALSGDLGSGKTTFTQGFAKAIGIKENIISPTFVLIREHHIPNSNRILFHIDLYRLEQINFRETGIQEIIDNSDNIVLIEWAEKAKDQLPENTKWINFKNRGQDNREITIE